MEQFPGRMLEELDGIDFTRLLRANKVKQMERIETLRALQLRGKVQPSPQDWRGILRHDRLMQELQEKAEEDQGDEGRKGDQ